MRSGSLGFAAHEKHTQNRCTPTQDFVVGVVPPPTSRANAVMCQGSMYTLFVVVSAATATLVALNVWYFSTVDSLQDA